MTPDERLRAAERLANEDPFRYFRELVRQGKELEIEVRLWGTPKKKETRRHPWPTTKGARPKKGEGWRVMDWGRRGGRFRKDGVLYTISPATTRGTKYWWGSQYDLKFRDHPDLIEYLEDRMVEWRAPSH